jgi:hypothetical protein
MSLLLDGTPQHAISTSGVSSLALPAMSTTFKNGKAFIYSLDNGSAGITSITGGGLTWTKRLLVGVAGTTLLEEWSAPIGGTALSSTIFTVNYAAGSTYNVIAGFCISDDGNLVVNFDPGGPQSAVGSNTDPSITTSSTISSKSIVFSGYRTTLSTGGTVGSGWTSIMSGITSSFMIEEYQAETALGTYTSTRATGTSASSIIDAVIALPTSAPGFNMPMLGM